MSEIKGSGRTQEERERERLLKAAQKIYDEFRTGTLKLTKPFSIGETEYTELPYNFEALSGWEYASAWDRAEKGDQDHNAFTMTAKKALSLFASAVNKCVALDAQDVIENLGPIDGQKAIRITTVFFNAAGVLANNS